MAGRFFLIQSPGLEPLGQGKKALCLAGSVYVYKKGTVNGRGQAIKVGPAKNACSLVRDGNMDAFALRVQSDQDLALEVNFRKNEVGTPLSVWCNIGHRDWACRFSLNPDMTISPTGHSRLVLGVDLAHSPPDTLILVQDTDTARRLVFSSSGSPEEREHLASIQLRRDEEAKVAHAQQALVREVVADRSLLQQLKDQGFVKVSGLVSSQLVVEALREVNRQVGQCQGDIDKFKNKYFPSHPAITGLFNKSAIPLLVQELLGQPSVPHQSSAQLALRFPGDLCVPGTVETNLAWSEGVRKQWHIDGCPNNFIPGSTDHYGEIHNFDCLVGVLLSTTTRQNSGELCIYPGSHYELAQYFKDQKNLDAVYKHGNEQLPTGDRTDSVLKSKPVHCIGKTGDVFLANYMTAHFIAPNTCENIRYAVYFRVSSVGFGGKQHCKQSMLQPWVNWKGLEGLK